MFDSFDKIFIINLKRRPDRLKQFFKNNKKYLTPLNVEIFEAFDGNLITDQEWKFKPGALGCWLSHITLLEKIEKAEYEKVLILEDDAIINDIELINNEELTEFLKRDDWDMFYFGGFHFTEPECYSNEIIKLRKSLSAHAYSVNKKSVKLILQYAKDKKYWIDGIYSELHSILRCYGTRKQMIVQTKSKSDIEINQNFLITLFKMLKAKII